MVYTHETMVIADYMHNVMLNKHICQMGLMQKNVLHVNYNDKELFDLNIWGVILLK